MPLAADTGLAQVAAATPGLVGADLRNLVNEAALLAARRGEDAVHQKDFLDALEKIVLGPARPIVPSPAERRMVPCPPTTNRSNRHSAIRCMASSPIRTVVIRQDSCNGCQYCVPSCPYGVITADEAGGGTAHKCTLCYDRLKGGYEPACAKSCPTYSIQFGPIEELRERARARVAGLHAQGFPNARLYGDQDGLGATNGVRSLHSFSLLMDEPNVYGLPAEPTLPARHIVPALAASAATAGFLIGATVLALLGRR